MVKQKAEKEPSILDVINAEYPQYLPSKKAQQVVTDTYSKFRYMADERNRSYQYFDGIDLISYINDSVKRFTTNVDERDGIEDWQARVFDPFTRTRVLAVLSKVVQKMPIAQFRSRGDEDPRKGVILTNIYEYVEDPEEYEETMTHILLEAIVKGTAIGYEGVEREVCSHRDVKGVGDDIIVTESKEEKTLFPTTLVPLEDFYPSSVSVRTIKKMPYCVWRSVITYSEFMESWGEMYELSKYVVPKFTMLGTEMTEVKPFYYDFVSQDVTDGNVEIIRYYSKAGDEFIIIANGVWLNPIKNTNEDISPLPFNHKRLPFFEVKYDFFGDWFYGKSLPDKLKSMQDVLNVLTNMLLDQSFLTIFPPMLTSGMDSIEDDYLRPGRRTPIDTQGKSLQESFMKLDMGTPSGWHQYILEYTRKIMEQSSLDQVATGQAGVGGRTTATEIQSAADAVTQILGVFGMLIKYGVKQKAVLKGANILQFGTDEKIPLVRKVLGEDGVKDFNKYFNIVKLGDTVLTNGKRGIKVIEMYGEGAELPQKDALAARAQIAEMQTGRATEIIALPASYIRNFEFDVEIIPNPKSDSTKDMAKAIQLEKVRVYMSFFPNIVDVNELAAQTAVVMGDDPTKIIRQDILNPKAAPAEGATESPMSTDPQSNVSGNQASSAMGNESANKNLNILLKGNL